MAVAYSRRLRSSVSRSSSQHHRQEQQQEQAERVQEEEEEAHNRVPRQARGRPPAAQASGAKLRRPSRGWRYAWGVWGRVVVGGEASLGVQVATVQRRLGCCCNGGLWLRASIFIGKGCCMGVTGDDRRRCGSWV